MRGVALLKLSQTRFFGAVIFSLLLFVALPGFCRTQAASPAPGPKLPYQAQSVLLKAQTLMKAEKFSQAAEILAAFQKHEEPRKEATDDSQTPYHHYLIDFTLANCYLMTEARQQALLHYRAALKSYPEFRAGWVNLGRCGYELEEYPTAAAAFHRAYLLGVEKEPQFLYLTALAWLGAGQRNEALTYLDQLFKNHSENIKLEWRAAYVRICLAMDQPRRALSCIEILSEETTGKRKLQWQETRLQEYLVLEMNKKALAYAQKLIREDPLRAQWWQGLAHLHLGKNRYRQALVALLIKGYLKPLDEAEMRLLADLNQVLGIPQEAVRYYETIAQGGLDIELTRRLADGYRALHQPDSALDWVEQGLARKADPALLMFQGELLFELKKYREAAAAFTAAAQTPAQAGQAWLMAGYAAWNEGEYEQARKNLTAAAKYPKRRRAAEQALLQLKSSEFGAK